MERHCRIIQVVGYQNSGKTTLMEKLIKECSSNGWQVASIKHHGHNTAQKKEISLKDSERHERAGAFMTAVEGGGALQLHIKDQSWSLSKLLELYKHFSPDVVCVEGFKREAYPKVVLVRGKEDLELLQLERIICVITWHPLNIESSDYPIYNIKDCNVYLEYILQKLSDNNGSATI